MGDSKAPATPESMASIMAGITQQLPSFMQVMNSQVLPTSQTQLQTAQQISPAYQQLLADIYKSVAPQLANTGTEVEKINRTGAADTDLSILEGSGGQLAREGQALDKELNPEYYNTRTAAADKLGQLLNSVNLNDANPEAERLVNQENIRSGNLNMPSATSTVSNALSFGDERTKRMMALGNAVNSATNFLQPATSQFNPISTALNRPANNTGESRFTGVTPASTESYTAGNNLLGSGTQLQNTSMDINANKRDILDRLTETTSSLP